MILGLIPARGGSKGIPRKNLQPLLDKPLIAWTIQAAKNAVMLDRFVVSTEDPEIAAVSRQWGAEVLDRPTELADDRASTLDVMKHALHQIPARLLVVLQPTQPIRDPDLIDSCLRRFIEVGADSLATGFICKYRPYGVDPGELRRQDIDGFFYDDGNIYINRADLVLTGDRYGTRRERMCIDREQNTDIDEPFDLWLAEKILERRRQRTSYQNH